MVYEKSNITVTENNTLSYLSASTNVANVTLYIKYNTISRGPGLFCLD